MRKILFVVVVVMASLLFSTNAMAQGKAYRWTGFYAGGQGMYLTGNSDWEMGASWNSIDHNVNGGMGGFFLGYNYQLPINLVLGAETELNFGQADGSSFCPNPEFNCESRLYWLGSTKFRLGYAIDRFMPFVSVGWAYGGGENKIKDLIYGIDYKDSSFYFGAVPGVGFEVAITNNLLLRAEYNYYYFFRSEQEIDNVKPDIQVDMSAFKLGLSFKF
ncbi:MAG TPA: outer membrane beta-barrel protein [Smithellaceae bacterium]|jgi:outer membrane immunogenic protein|nr:porin family protein [Syntrophaceae bacterium]HPV48635.1 outer membrane beta-barrel protein [Smithellaceae bacterium]